MSLDRLRFPVALSLTELIDVTGTAWTCRLCQVTAGSVDARTVLVDGLLHVEAEHHGRSVALIPFDGPEMDRKLGPVSRYLSRLDD